MSGTIRFDLSGGDVLGQIRRELICVGLDSKDQRQALRVYLADVFAARRIQNHWKHLSAKEMIELMGGNSN